MVSLTFVLYCAFAYLILQFILTCFIRWYGNGIFTNPQILSRKDLTGYFAIVTGSNQGIGYYVAMYLVNHGAHVVLACRDDKRGKHAEKSINNQIKSNAIYKGGKAEYINCDLSKLNSTKLFIKTYKNKKYPLHLLINNAGSGGRHKMKFSVDGIDMIWQINYLSHFLITYELLPIMIQSNKNKTFDCRIINTSSSWHQYGFININTLTSDKSVQIQKHKTSGIQYGTSKLAQILHATYMQTEIFSRFNIPISICALHPGGVRTSIWKANKWAIHMKLGLIFLYPSWYFGMRNAEQGSRTTIYCAIAPIGEHENIWGGIFIPGAYHDNLKATITKDSCGQSTNPKHMKKLYKYSLDILDLKQRTKQDYNLLINNGNINNNIVINPNVELFGIIDMDDEKDESCDDVENVLKDGLIVLTDNSYWFYNICDGMWKKLIDLNDEQKCFDGPVVLYNDNKIYRIGGRNIKSDQCMKQCEYFDMNSLKWYKMNGMLNERRCSSGGIFLNKYLLLIGGDDNGDELSSMEEYDFNNMKWNLRGAMNKTRNDFGICSISNEELLLVIGGHSVDVNNGITGYLNSIEKYNYNDDKWELLNTTLPFDKRARCGVLNWKEYKSNNIIIAGGTL
eukprot:287828_1